MFWDDDDDDSDDYSPAPHRPGWPQLRFAGEPTPWPAPAAHAPVRPLRVAFWLVAALAAVLWAASRMGPP